MLGAKCFGKLDLLQEYWQTPLAPEAQEVFTIVTPEGLSDMRRPQTASELMQFLQAAKWLRTSLPRMAEVVERLRVFLKQLMAGASLSLIHI